MRTEWVKQSKRRLLAVSSRRRNVLEICHVTSEHVLLCSRLVEQCVVLRNLSLVFIHRMRLSVASLTSHLLFAVFALLALQLVQSPQSLGRHVNRMSNLMQTTTGGASTIKINVSGSHTLHRVAELCTVTFNVVHESTDRKATVTKVTEKTNEISALLRGLAPAAVAATVDFGEADQNAEERDIDKPVAKWSMGSVHTHSYVPYIPDRSSSAPEPPMKYQTSATFSVTFRDFQKLESFVGDLTVRMDHV